MESRKLSNEGLGWGQYVADSLSTAVSNKAIGGHSSRSYTLEGRFQAIADVLKEGDYVVIELRHNDGGSLSTDNGRSVCSGSGDETCTTVYSGFTETVLTFPKYLENASQIFLEKGAHVLISSQTPNNVWETELAAGVASVEYADHGAYVASIYEALGEDRVNSFYSNDHTHPNNEGVQVVADAFFKAVVWSGVALSDVLTTTDLEGRMPAVN